MWEIQTRPLNANTLLNQNTCIKLKPSLSPAYLGIWLYNYLINFFSIVCLSVFMENQKYNFSQNVHSCPNTDNSCWDSCPNVSTISQETKLSKCALIDPFIGLAVYHCPKNSGVRQRGMNESEHFMLKKKKDKKSFNSILYLRHYLVIIDGIIGPNF